MNLSERIEKHTNYLNKSENMQYTIVSAVYNVEKYLPKFFSSITSQSIGFQKHIILVMVDDGSSDNSADIIKKWQQKYPDNIFYIKKKNGGQASARNLGMRHVKTEWVAFIDPDDFIGKHYFKIITTSLLKYPDLSLIVGNMIYYFENLHLYLNRHPLRYRFKNDQTLLNSDNLQHYIHLSASSALFRTSIIKEHHLSFNSKIQPNFEDGHFVNRYLLLSKPSPVIFLSKAKYYYRKRKDGSSSIDRSWQTPDRYDAVLRYGYLDLITCYIKAKGYLPNHIQRTILYDLIWHFRVLLQTPSLTDILSTKQKQTYHTLLQKIFTYIDSDTIISFELAGITHMHKLGILYHYKNIYLSYQMVYANIEQHSLLKLHFYTPTSTPEYHIYIDQQEITPPKLQTEVVYFADALFLYLHRCEISLPSDAKRLQMTIDHKKTCFQENTTLEILPIDKPLTPLKKRIEEKVLDWGRKLVLGVKR
jgi:glycosyltransferase involved in cell wall biosynthesis